MNQLLFLIGPKHPPDTFYGLNLLTAELCVASGDNYPGFGVGLMGATDEVA